MRATLTANSKVTIPKSVRETLGLKAGDRLELLLTKDGGIEIRPLTSITNLEGIMPKPEKPATLADMEKAILEGACS